MLKTFIIYEGFVGVCCASISGVVGDFAVKGFGNTHLA
jgi:hypothetical protein